jgi:hypothetical protein
VLQIDGFWPIRHNWCTETPRSLSSHSFERLVETSPKSYCFSSSIILSGAVAGPGEVAHLVFPMNPDKTPLGEMCWRVRTEHPTMPYARGTLERGGEHLAGFIIFGVVIWRSGVLPGPAAISLGLHAPLVEGFVRAQLNWVSVVGALLFILESGVIAFSVLRRLSAGETEANAGS